MSIPKRPKREPVVLVRADALDADHFADRIADAAVAAITEIRRARGLPPLAEDAVSPTGRPKVPGAGPDAS